MMDDAELLRRYLEGRSDAAFSELVRRHVDMVYAAALRQMGGNHALAQDVTQMVFIRLSRKAAALIRHPALAAWLYRTCHLEALSAGRGEGRRRRYEEKAGAEGKLLNTEEARQSWEDAKPVLDGAMNRLSESDRRAILLRFFSNRPFAEIGRQLGLTENAARMRVDRALAKLREQLGRRGIVSSSAALAAALATEGATAAPAGVAAAAASAALAGGGASVGAWIAFMSTTKFPLGLTAALVLGSASVAVWQQRAAAQTDRDLADLNRQNQFIQTLKDQNRLLAIGADQARNLRDASANLPGLRDQVRAAQASAEEKGAAAAARGAAQAHAKSARTMAMDAGIPALDPSAEDQAPVNMSLVKPHYPAAMRQAGISGQVVVDFVVGSDGTVYNAQAVSSTDSNFEDSAVQALSQWTFKPGQKDGQSVYTHMQIPISYSIGRPGWF